jgi:hypothetical protein
LFIRFTKRAPKEDKEAQLYALLLKYPTGKLGLGSPKTTPETKIILFGFGELQVNKTSSFLSRIREKTERKKLNVYFSDFFKLLNKWSATGDQGLEVDMPPMQMVNSPPYGWVLRISRLDNF